MTKTEILSNLGIGSGINTTELIKALVDADTAPQKENLDNLEDATNPQLLEFLGQLMRDVDFDLREFQRVVLNTKTYQQQASMTPPEGENFRFPGPLLRRMTAEQIWDSIVLLLRGPEIAQIKTDHAPSIERLVFPFEFENDSKI